jgi:hypothetical protein
MKKIKLDIKQKEPKTILYVRSVKEKTVEKLNALAKSKGVKLSELLDYIAEKVEE